LEYSWIGWAIGGSMVFDKKYLVILFLFSSIASAQESRCPDYSPEKRVLWGDLHVHTTYSFDAINMGTMHIPADAYSFAKGNPIPLVSGKMQQLDRPLDFTGVTDHSEWLGKTNRCQAGEIQGAVCAIDMVASYQGSSSSRGYNVMTAWIRSQNQTNDAYDRCNFTSFVAYEYSGGYGSTTGPKGMHHRNIIFKGAKVPNAPLSALATQMGGYPKVQDMLRGLATECNALNDCDFVSIPHNSNFSEGEMFDLSNDTPADSKRRARYERLVEIMQAKGESECLTLNQDDTYSDPDCGFEKAFFKPFKLERLTGISANLVTPAEYAKIRTSYVRPSLKRGIEHFSKSGKKVNPLKLGIIGSTDTHNGNPGMVAEDKLDGTHANQDIKATDRLTYPTSMKNAGAIVAVWAEENTRESIFAALKRRETYASSGPRIQLEFYQTWDRVNDPCATNVTKETVMGGDIKPQGGNKPVFVVNALRDKVNLARVDIIQAFVGADGKARERVFSKYAATNGEGRLCKSFDKDDGIEYNPGQAAFWYARVLEVPTKRWSKYDCEKLDNCNDRPGLDKMIQERVWSSPIWNLPGEAGYSEIEYSKVVLQKGKGGVTGFWTLGSNGKPATWSKVTNLPVNQNWIVRSIDYDRTRDNQHRMLVQRTETGSAEIWKVSSAGRIISKLRIYDPSKNDPGWLFRALDGNNVLLQKGEKGRAIIWELNALGKTVGAKNVHDEKKYPGWIARDLEGNKILLQMGETGNAGIRVINNEGNAVSWKKIYTSSTNPGWIMRGLYGKKVLLQRGETGPAGLWEYNDAGTSKTWKSFYDPSNNPGWQIISLDTD